MMGGVSDRLPLPALLLSGRVIAPLPEVTSGQVLALGEVMIQENITAWTLPVAARAAVPELLELFCGRVAIGLRGRFATSELESLLTDGVEFLTTEYPDPGLPAAAAAAGMPLLAGALTPTEIVRAWESGAAAVNVVPCDALGVDYAQHLAAEIPEIPVIATGRVDTYVAETWLEAGAVAVSPTVDLLGNALSGGALAGLRVRCRDFAAVVERTRRAG